MPEELLEKKPTKKSKNKKLLLIFGIVFLVVGVALIIIPFLMPKEEILQIVFPKIPSSDDTAKTYNILTGEEISDESLNSAPLYCIQTPNGTDGARPQAGLDQAGVVFEAIAEAGITRFAAIYQKPTSGVIGPIRSLRVYFLDWDTPFDCTIVNAGGPENAMTAVKSGGYENLTENYTYMYRGTYSKRRWNNLFTTGSYLAQVTSDRGYGGSSPKTFARLTPEEAEKERIDSLVTNPLKIDKGTEGDTSELAAKVDSIDLAFGWMENYNVHYDYDLSTNSYKRGYASGVSHEIYSCPKEDIGERNPEDACTLTVLAPKVVVAMVVNEKRAAGGYLEDITTIGSGDVYIFQNGIVKRGTWSKSSKNEQIMFSDSDGNEIKLAPGQTFISAVPAYGSVEF